MTSPQRVAVAEQLTEATRELATVAAEVAKPAPDYALAARITGRLQEELGELTAILRLMATEHPQ